MTPYARWWSQQDFWRVDPDFTAIQLRRGDSYADELVPVTLASTSRELVLSYLFTRGSGKTISKGQVLLRLPNGDYRVEFFRPSDALPLAPPVMHASRGIHRQDSLALPDFTDDIALRIVRTVTRDQGAIPGTR